MATRLDIDTRVDAPAEELFDLMADPETEVGWNPDALDVRRIGAGPVGPGAEWQGRYKGMGSMRIRLDEYERPRRLVFSITGDRMDMHWAFTFTPDAGATRLAAAAELRPKGAMLHLPAVGADDAPHVLPSPGATGRGRRGATLTAAGLAKSASRSHLRAGLG